LGAALQADGETRSRICGLKHQKEKRSMDYFCWTGRVGQGDARRWFKIAEHWLKLAENSPNRTTRPPQLAVLCLDR
jgi:hypothetical protein